MWLERDETVAPPPCPHTRSARGGGGRRGREEEGQCRYSGSREGLAESRGRRHGPLLPVLGRRSGADLSRVCSPIYFPRESPPVAEHHSHGWQNSASDRRGRTQGRRADKYIHSDQNKEPDLNIPQGTHLNWCFPGREGAYGSPYSFAVLFRCVPRNLAP